MADWLTVALYVLVLAVQLFMSYDNGATSACIDEIGKTGKWTAADLGLLGALDKIGMTIGSVFWGRALQTVPAKVLLVLGISVNAVCSLIFGLVPIWWSMFVCKFLMGVTQALQLVFGSCWVVLWAPERVRTLCLSLGSAAAALGTVLGMGVTGITTAHGLPYSFAYIIDVSFLASLWVLLLGVPGWRFGINVGSKGESQTPTRASADISATMQALDAEAVAETQAPDTTPAVPHSPIRQLRFLATERVYVWTCLSLAMMCFVLNGVQFLWIRVFVEAFGIDKNMAVTVFLTITACGGGCGTFVGPFVLDRVGDLNTPNGRVSTLKAIVSILHVAMLGAGLCIAGLLWRAAQLGGPVPAGSLVLAWGGFFLALSCTSSVIAGLGALNVTAFPPSLRSLASGYTISIQNLAGYAMGPLVSGALIDFIMQLAGFLQWDTRTADSDYQRALLFGMVFVLLGSVATVLTASRALLAAQRASAQLMDPWLKIVVC